MHNHERSHCRRIAERVDLDRTPAYDPNRPVANRNPPIVAYKKTQVSRIVNTTLSDSGTRWPNIAETNHTEYRNPDNVRACAALTNPAACPLYDKVVEEDCRGVRLFSSAKFFHTREG